MRPDLRERAVVLVGGDGAVDRAIALACGQSGAHLHLVGSDAGGNTQGLAADLAAAGAAAPSVHASDDLDALYAGLAVTGGAHAILGRVADDGVDDLADETAFVDGQRHAWRLVEHLQAARRAGSAPCVVQLAGSEHAVGPGTAAGTVAEILGRYLATHGVEEGVRVNTVRSPALDPGGGDPATTRRLADAVLELCGGRLDAMSGQTLTVDGGARLGTAAADDDHGWPVARASRCQRPGRRSASCGSHALDWEGRAVLVTGGTGGIGLATGLAFGALGARAWLTYRWGTHDLDEVRRRFAVAGAPEPRIVEADAASADDTDALWARIAAAGDDLRAFVSNVTFARVGRVNEATPFRDLARGLRYSAWPVVEGVRACQRHLGRAPRYVVGVSSVGPDHYYPGYDFVAASKAALESLCRTLAAELAPAGSRVNVLRAAPVPTDALDATFGPEFIGFCRRYDHRPFLVSREEVAAGVVALCAGGLDGVVGQTLCLDHGISFSDNLSRLYEDRRRYGLAADGEA